MHNLTALKIFCILCICSSLSQALITTVSIILPFSEWHAARSFLRLLICIEVCFLSSKYTYTHPAMHSTRRPEINAQVYGQLIFDKGAKNIQWGKDFLLKEYHCINLISTWLTIKSCLLKTAIWKLSWND